MTRTGLENKVTALRFVEDTESDYGDYVERDAFVHVEVGDPESERGIDLHIDPRTDDVVTVGLSPDEAWRLARELARAASVHEEASA